MIYIVVPTYNRITVCEHFVDDLNKQTYSDYELILVDHGKCKTGINGKKIKCINSDVNGWAKAVNVGLRYVLSLDTNEDDIVLIINDDVIIENDYLENIILSVKEKPNAVLGTICLDQSSKKTLRVAIKLNRIIAEYRYIYQNIRIEEIDEDYIESDVLTGKGTVIPVNILRKIGIYREDKLPHYKADHELIWRAKKSGIPIYASKRMFLYTLSDQKKANGKEKFIDTVKFMFFDMRSTINIKDCWNYAFLAYSLPYALYFFSSEFIRNTVYMFVDYIRSR